MIGRTIRSLLGAALAIALAGPPAIAGASVRRRARLRCMASRPCRPTSTTCLTSIPQAPKGGALNLAYLGAFDSLNPYNVKALSTAQGSSATSISR